MTTGTPNPSNRGEPRVASAPVVVAMVFLALLVPSQLAAQEPSDAPRGGPRIAGNIRGMAFDSVGGRPLEDALIMLLDAGGVTIREQVRTDGEGRFLLADVPVGEHVVVLEHGRLDELGLTPILRSVEVTPSSESTVRLDTPSLATLWPLFCEEPRSGAVGVIYGRTLDSVTGVAQPDVTVTATWRRANGRVGSASARTDPTGSFNLCGIPANTPVTVAARFVDGSVSEEVVQLEGPVIQSQDLAFSLGRPSAIQGFITDAQTGEPIPSAEVALAGTDRRAVTGVDGSFRFPDLEQGAYTLEMEHLAYGRQQKELLLGSRTLEVEARFSPRAIELEGVTVSVLQPQLEDRGFYTRRRRLGASQATMLTTEELLARDSVSLPWALRNIPATEMRMSARDGPTLQHRSRGGTCDMPVYLDGMLMVDVFNMASIPPDQILGIEVYPPQPAGFNLMPEEFRSRADYPGCGGVLIWTR